MLRMLSAMFIDASPFDYDSNQSINVTADEPRFEACRGRRGYRLKALMYADTSKGPVLFI